MSGTPTGPSDLSGLEGILSDQVRVLRFPHQTEPDEDGSTRDWHCDIVVSDGVPAQGFRSYATVGVRDFDTNVTASDGRVLRTEFVTVSRTGYAEMADILDACALATASGSFHIQPGAVLPNALGVIDNAARCQHMLLVPPFLWPELTVVSDEPEYVLTRLQAVPVTTEEMTLATENGHEALFEALDSRKADVTDPNRASVV